MQNLIQKELLLKYQKEIIGGKVKFRKTILILQYLTWITNFHRTLGHSVQFTDDNKTEDIELGLGINSSRRTKVLKKLTKRTSRYFEDKDDRDNIQKTQLSKLRRKRTRFKNCWKKFYDSTIKLRSIIANIFMNSIDTGTDAFAAKIHYE